MRRFFTLNLAALLLTASTAIGAQNLTVQSLPDKGPVTISGKVDKVNNAQNFTLRDDSGAIKVTLASGESAVLKQGDSVTVTGAVESPFWGLMGKSINATDVKVHKDIASTLADAVTKTTGISFDKAESADIGKLPDEGIVKLTGTVEKVDNEKNFTLKDTTGTVDVTIQSEKNIVLTQGAHVTVIGYVNNNAPGKKILANRVILTAAEAEPAAGGNTN